MGARHHTSLLRVASAVSAAVLALAAVADDAATCPDPGGDECLTFAGAGRGGRDSPPVAPAHDCAGRPCRTPLSVAPPVPTVHVREAVATVVSDPVKPPVCAEPAAPPTPPPVALR